MVASDSGVIEKRAIFRPHMPYPVTGNLNPLRAKIVSDIKELNKYPYSGHSVLTGEKKHEWQGTEYVQKADAKFKLRPGTCYAIGQFGSWE
jgi:hypothetical protein